MARLEIRRATSVRFLCEQFMNRIFLFLLMVVAAVLSGQFENRAIGQMDSVFYTPPYVRAGEFSLREVQPYQMSSSFESKFVPLSSKEAGNFSQFTTPSLSVGPSMPPSNLNFPSNANPVNLGSTSAVQPRDSNRPSTAIPCTAAIDGSAGSCSSTAGSEPTELTALGFAVSGVDHPVP